MNKCLALESFQKFIFNLKLMNLRLKQSIIFACFCALLISVVGFSGCSSHSSSSAKVRVFGAFEGPFKPKVAALEFRRDSGGKKKGARTAIAGLFTNPDAGKIIANMFTNELTKSELFIVLDQETVRKRLKKSGYKDIQNIERSEYKELKKILNVDAIVTGTYKRFGFLYPTMIPRIMVKFYAEYIDIETGDILWSIRVKDYSSSDRDERDLARRKIARAVNNLKFKLQKQ